MLSAIFTTLFFQPLYNLLVWLIGLMPGNDLGLAIIALTILVRLILFPLYHHSTKTQNKMKLIEPELKAIKTNHPTDKQEQARLMMELYKAHGVNPFSGFMLILIQLPIIFALYQVFRSSVAAHADLIYSFIHLPATTNPLFLGLIDITGKSIVAAVIVGLSQFIQMQLALPPLSPRQKGETSSFSADMSRNMQLQMKYFLPVFIVFIAASLPVAISLYWLTSNLFAIGHELLVKRDALKLFGQVKRP